MSSAPYTNFLGKVEKITMTFFKLRWWHNRKLLYGTLDISLPKTYWISGLFQKKSPHSMLHTHLLPYHREAEMRERLVVVIVVVAAAILRLAMPWRVVTAPRRRRRATMRKSSHLSLVNLPTHCAMSNYFAHNSRPPRNKKLLLPTVKSIIISPKLKSHEWREPQSLLH